MKNESTPQKYISKTGHWIYVTLWYYTLQSARQKRYESQVLEL